MTPLLIAYALCIPVLGVLPIAMSPADEQRAEASGPLFREDAASRPLVHMAAASADAALFDPALDTSAQEPTPPAKPSEPQSDASPPADDTARPRDAGRGGFGPQMGERLAAALRASPGCLGVDSGFMASGKAVIFAWFENKQAVLKWYYSDTHGQMAGLHFEERSGEYKPLRQIPDDTGPLLVIASLTPAAAPGIEGVNMPISQIAIEIYQPMPGGLSINGTFTPAPIKVPGRFDQQSDSPKAEPTPAPAGSGDDAPRP